MSDMSTATGYRPDGRDGGPGRERPGLARLHRVLPRNRLRDLTLMSASSITIIGTTAIAAGLPRMRDAFAAVPHSQLLIGLALTLPALSAGVCAPVMGIIVDRFGRKRLFIVALLLYGTAGCAGFFLDSLYAILLSRFILGIAVSGVATCATALISDFARRGALGASMGRQSLFMALGNVIFVFTGGLLAGFGWRWPFLLYAVGFVLVPGVVLLLDEPAPEPLRPLAGPTAAATAGEPDRGEVGLRSWVYALLFLNMLIYFMVPVHLPFYLKQISHSHSAQSGAMLSLVGVAWAVSSTQYKRLERFLGYEQILIITFTLLATANVLLGVASGYALVIPALILMGTGLGLSITALNTWLLALSPPQAKGRIIGTMVFFTFIGQFLSPIVTQPVISGFGFAGSYVAAGCVLACIAAITAARVVSAEPAEGRRVGRVTPL
ncbi:MAG: MFS transporter [Dermatophilaceae bacterium]